MPGDDDALALWLARVPRQIECHGISDLAGTLAVGSRVAFERGIADKHGYRR